MDMELAKQGMQLVHDFELGVATAGEIDSQAIAALTALLTSAVACDEMDDDTCDELFGSDDPIDLAVAAIEMLANHNAVDAIDGIIAFADCQFTHSDFDDSLLDTLPKALSSFSISGIALLLEHAVLRSHDETTRCILIEAVKQWGQNQQEERCSLESMISQGLNNARANPIRVNTDLMMLVIHWKLKGFGESIERAFSIDRIDCGMAGEWSEIRRQLHVEGMGLPMPERPYNSMEDLRKKAGVGVFSNKPLVMHGEIEEAAAEEYLDNALDAFRGSDEGQQLQSKGQRIGYLYNFLDLGLTYLGVSVDSMTVASAREILLELFPRKMSMDPRDCKKVIDELCAFWGFVDRVHQLESAKQIENAIRSMLAEFRREMSNTDNFGMAKSLITAGVSAGFDMTSQDDIQKFIQLYNTSVVAQREASSGNGSSFSRVEYPSPSEPPKMSLKQRKKLLAKKKRK